MESTVSDLLLDSLFANETGLDYMTTFTSPIPYITTIAPNVSDLKCNYYRKANTTIMLYGGYEGIPQNLIINSIGWLALVLLFCVLRKRAWNYGRMALIQKKSNRSTLQGYNGYNVWTQLFYAGDERLQQIGPGEADPSSSLDLAAQIDEGFFSWIVVLFRIKDDQIRAKCGPDSVQYLSFQRHVIVLTSIITLVSVGIALPLNFQGTLEGDEKSFGHTTLSNLDPRSSYLWVHISLAILFMPLAVFMMRKFSYQSRIPESESNVSRTLVISRIPRKHCNKAELLQHFHETYPDTELQDIQFAYDVKTLMGLDRERLASIDARRYCERYIKSSRQRLEMRPLVCGSVCICCDPCGCPVTDALEFYTEEEKLLTEAVEKEKERSLKRPVGVAFVTFATQADAVKVKSDHQKIRVWTRGSPRSTLSDKLKPHNWFVSFAPSPEDIHWENVSISRRWWYLKSFLIHALLFLLLFFLTTPAIVVSTLDTIQFTSQLQRMSPILSEFLPTLLLWTISALMPVLVSYSDQWVSHWTRSEANHSVMRKTFVFLLFMVVVLPSLGLTSAKAFVEWTFHANETYRWECVFLPDNGAFFVNYIITSSFIGTSLELIRFADLFYYAIRLCSSRSQAETGTVRRMILSEFQFGVQYAWMLLIFSVTVMYSLSCPLITPFGLVYMLFKHYVDKYNIFYAYGPSKINKRIHATAINFVVAAVLLLQLTLLFFSFIRRGLHDTTIYSLVGFCVTLAVVLAQAFLHWCPDFSPISYELCKEVADDTPTFHGRHQESVTKSFKPYVLNEGLSAVAIAAENALETVALDLSATSMKSVDENSSLRKRNSDSEVKGEELYQNYGDSEVNSSFA